VLFGAGLFFAARPSAKVTRKRAALIMAGAVVLFSVGGMVIAPVPAADAEPAVDRGNPLDIAVHGDHLNVEARIAQEAPQGLITAVAQSVRAARDKLGDQGVGDLKTASFHFRLLPAGAGAKDLPLVTLDYDGDELAGLSKATTIEILNRARETNVRTDAPAAERLLRGECEAAEFGLRATPLCQQAEGHVER
jgi:hypothetical protein